MRAKGLHVNKMEPRPNSMFILFVVLNVVTKLQPCDSAVRLPYEVENTIIEHTDPSEYVRGLDKVNVSDANVTRAIYRKDLPSYYVAYYEIEAEGKYIVLSAGSKTGDYREAESGPSPRPTDVLSQQAKKHGQTCIKYFRLNPFGLMICENEEGKAVAATFNWTSDVSEIINWNELDQMIKKDSKQFMRSWRLWAKDVNKSSEWKTTELLNNSRGSKEFEAEGIDLGSAVNLALPVNFESIRIYIHDLGKKLLRKSFPLWQSRLCEVLYDICSDDGKIVKRTAIKKTRNGFPYLLIKVKKEGVHNILKHKEVGFVVAISSQDGETLLKHYAIDLRSNRQKRWNRRVRSNTWKIWSIPREHYFPDYNQHKCCGCVSGCTPVAWAQIFAYYDRLAHFSIKKYGHSKRLFRCGGTRWGSPRCVAPLKMTSSVKTFVENIRARLKTYCKNGQGFTKRKNTKRINMWYKWRQGFSAKVEHYLHASKGKGSSTVGKLTVYGKKSEERNQAIKALKGNPAYPVAVSIDVASKGNSRGGHKAVVSRYGEKRMYYRKHVCRKVGWWWAKKTKCQYIWLTVYNRKFYFHMGWGGSGNAWHTALAYMASIAKPY